MNYENELKVQFYDDSEIEGIKFNMKKEGHMLIETQYLMSGNFLVFVPKEDYKEIEIERVNRNCQLRIREKYTESKEFQILRESITNPQNEEFLEYDAFVRGILNEANTEKERLNSI